MGTQGTPDASMQAVFPELRNKQGKETMREDVSAINYHN